MRKVFPIVIFIVAILGLFGFWQLTHNLAGGSLAPQGEGGTSSAGDPETLRAIMQAVITIPLLCGGLFVILSKRFAPNDKHWAYATIGTLLGFWLKV